MYEQMQGNVYIRTATLEDRAFVNQLISEIDTWTGHTDMLDYFNEQRDTAQEQRLSLIIEKVTGRRNRKAVPVGFRQVSYYKVPKLIVNQVTLNTVGYPISRQYFDWVINYFSEATDIIALAPKASLRTLAKQRIPEIIKDDENNKLRYHIRD